MDVLLSYADKLPPSLLELGFSELVAIYSDLSNSGKPPAIISASDLQEDPEGTLYRLCLELAIPYNEKMLSWPTGPKAIDGPWAPFWYDSVHLTSCFKYRNEADGVQPFDFAQYDLLEQIEPMYTYLLNKLKSSALPPPKHPILENNKLLIWVDGEILPRQNAKVSVFDSLLKEGNNLVSETIEMIEGELVQFYYRRIKRFLGKGKKEGFMKMPSEEKVNAAVLEITGRNNMDDTATAHISLFLTRGKLTSHLYPEFGRYKCTLIVMAEWLPGGKKKEKPAGKEDEPSEGPEKPNLG